MTCDCDRDWNPAVQDGHWPSCPAFDHTGHLCGICQPAAVDRLFTNGVGRGD